MGVDRNKIGRCPELVCVLVVAGGMSACHLGHLLLQKPEAGQRSILWSCKNLGVQLHGGRTQDTGTAAGERNQLRGAAGGSRDVVLGSVLPGGVHGRRISYAREGKTVSVLRLLSQKPPLRKSEALGSTENVENVASQRSLKPKRRVALGISSFMCILNFKAYANSPALLVA